MITEIKINEANKARWYEEGYWTEQTLNDVWSEQVKNYPDNEYISDDLGARYTYKEIDEKASKLASWLVSVGVKNGDVVSFQLPPWAEFPIIAIACTKVGAVMHPLSVTFNHEDLVYSMNLVESKAFICPSFHHKTDFEAQILSVVDRIDSLNPEAIAIYEKLRPGNGTLTLDQIFETFEPYTEPCPSKSDEILLILSTSGTTGKPKAVLFTHNTLLSAEHAFCKGFHLTHDDVCFMPSPLNHATGLNHGLISPMTLGGRVVLQSKFNPEEAVKIMNREGVTWSMGATPFIQDLLNECEKGNKLTTLKLYPCGGAPVPGDMVKWALKHGVLLCEVYGSTESSPHMYVPPEHCLDWDGAYSGIPFEGIEVKVVDGQHNEVPYGTQGEEASRGPNVFVGYLHNPEATNKDLDDEGWFYSGDLCYMTPEGRVRINGRKKEIIIRGGENISVNEVDNNIKAVPGVEDCAACGKPDVRLGERIASYIVTNDPETVTKDYIIKHLDAAGVAKRLWPEHIEYIEKIPRTETGKVRRNWLVDELVRRIKEREQG